MGMPFKATESAVASRSTRRRNVKTKAERDTGSAPTIIKKQVVILGQGSSLERSRFRLRLRARDPLLGAILRDSCGVDDRLAVGLREVLIGLFTKQVPVRCSAQ